MRILALLLAAGVLEISVLVFIGSKLGLLPTIGLLLLAAVTGSWLLRREGRRTLREFSDAARERRPPTRELADGVFIVAGGVLILLPGLISDVAGLLCLFPPTRKLLRRRLQSAAERRSQQLQDQLNVQARRAYGFQDFHGAQARGQASDDVIDGEVISVTDDDDEPQPNPRIIRPGRSSGPNNTPGGRENLA